jgi:hypothetical protein
MEGLKSATLRRSGDGVVVEECLKLNVFKKKRSISRDEKARQTGSAELKAAHQIFQTGRLDAMWNNGYLDFAHEFLSRVTEIL